ncbi:PAS domain S-box protein [Kribbella sp. VKM Ac-2566]|uniref:PAS domain S-box protein n=1 Tax=Kribbella sp. VKM Ac-2566 TaxID=2512218 RepID=UPI001064366D|nr:PAS domain S-box protein [Kribbella sp. VKM Ac-2566]TDW91908.1 PAS/PAC sensor hybrid histidine kinase [Kribbella sp. VKM Ac-2566]
MLAQPTELPVGWLEVTPDAIVGVTSDGVIVLANARVEALFGYSREELIGRPVEILVPEDARPLHPAKRARYVVEPRPRLMDGSSELTARRKDGTQFPAEISLSPIATENGTITFAAIRDVTERRELQAEREVLRAQADREQAENRSHQSQRLESLGQLAGGVAHDFNNLLSVILNYASFVEEEIKAVRGADQGRWDAALKDLQQIQGAAERGAGLTHQLLTFGRREVVRPRVLSLNAVVSNVKQLLQRTLDEQIDLVAVLAPDLWPVMADPGQIEQVLVNLAVNARDAMPNGGVLRIDTANVVVDEAYAANHHGLGPGQYVRLRLSDNGSGMSQDVIEHAFEPFFTTKPKGEGTGLGLATVYGIIMRMDGFVRIMSRPSEGSTFFMLIPATVIPADDLGGAEPGSQAQAQAQSSGRPSGGGETILVIEDEDAMREVTRRVLTRKGYRVLTAADGVTALELLSTTEEPVQLLLTDVVMPRMLGKDVADEASALRPGLRVLYMSGYAQPVLTSQGTLQPGVALIEKPFAQTELLTMVRDVLDAPGPPAN